MLVVGISDPRPIRLGYFDVGQDVVVVVDQSLPIAAEVDGVSGQVVRVFSWPLAPDLRSRSTALDVLISGESLMIASPAAGGVVVIDRRSGQATVIPLEADVGALTAGGDAVWAVADGAWCYSDTGGSLADGGGRTRPVVWEEPTAAEVARDEEDTRRDRLAGRSNPADGRPKTVTESLRERGDYVILGPPEPVWQIRGGAARRINADLESLRLAAAGGVIVGACRLPSDPLIRHVDPRGRSFPHRAPGTIIVLDDAGTVQAVGPVASTDGVICQDRGRIWLLGFDQQIGELEGPGPRELVLAEGRITESLDMRLHHPVGVVDGLVADLAWLDYSWDQMAVRFLPVDGGDPSQVPLPGLDVRARAKVAEGQVWVWQGSDAALTVVTPGTLNVRELRVELDCRPWIAPPHPPADLDLREFEHSQLDRFSALPRITLVDDQGRVSPFIEGVSFGAVELRGAFPDSHIVALFQSSAHPRIQFGRRWNLYDELGNPITYQFFDVHLQEDILTGALPPPSQCVPDMADVVWI